MAKLARFPVDAFESGRLPRICALSGEPTGSHMNVTVEDRPALPWLLFGVVPYFLARRGRRIATGQLPMTDETYKLVQQRRKILGPVERVGAGLVILGALLTLGLIGKLGLIGIGLGAATLLAGGIHARLRDPLRKLHFDDSGKWIELDNAADRFADAVSGAIKLGRI